MGVGGKIDSANRLLSHDCNSETEFEGIEACGSDYKLLK